MGIIAFVFTDPSRQIKFLVNTKSAMLLCSVYKYQRDFLDQFIIPVIISEEV